MCVSAPRNTIAYEMSTHPVPLLEDYDHPEDVDALLGSGWREGVQGQSECARQS